MTKGLLDYFAFIICTILLYAHGRAEEPWLVEATSCFLLVCFLGFVLWLKEGERVSMCDDGSIQGDR